ncbi:PilZ domain-containing protein [Clostridium beijerinckii]|uniref:PilZ domain-containing protein n=1 Tax=Clostridium beijerinckii TaxID=1520 RepID=UPI00098C7F9D|nr:PilZ domain-containing protein [Clostridium beijerinckii]NRT80586.1 c-di-GMP-binding flagellar brake protein YcgR [Clostridium beijerinckii]OOM47507.1 PilZ domain protein [Clostridium beijerinckii]
MKKKTFTVDISAGGLALITYEKIESGRLLFLSFKIKENISSVCSVFRSEFDEGDTNFKTALKFIDIDVNHRKIINEYVNEKMKYN